MHRLLRFSGLSVVLFLTMFYITTADAQQPSDQPTDEQQLIQKIKQEIMQELREGEFLREQIELGIQEHINRQQQAEVEARAEQARIANEKAKNVRRVSSVRDHIYGDPQAAISIIEYSDFECPYCKSFHSTPKQVVEAFKGQVNWVYRHFPLSFHNPGAQKQAEASECAAELGGNDAFWQYINAIYARTRSNGKGFPLTKLTPLAAEIGLNGERFQQCLDSGKYAARVEEDLAEGTQIGISGTPANILLNNQTGETRVKTGAQPLAAFKTDIEEMLN